MIKEITIRCEHGQIKVFWKWNNQDVARIEIAYKRKDSFGGDGTDFISGGVTRIPHIEIGSVTKNLCGEQGLYTFVFSPYKKDGSLAEKVVVDNVMLGNAIEINWNVQEIKEGILITFQKFNGYVPAGLLVVENEGVKCEIHKNISSNTRLLFPVGKQLETLTLHIKTPYDRVYRLHQK